MNDDDGWEYYDPEEFMIDENIQYDYLNENEQSNKKQERNLDDFEDEKYLTHLEVMKDGIINNNYTNKPIYYKKYMNTNDNIIKKIYNISKFTLISPIEVFYKLKYESFHKISQDDEKCVICLDHLYDIDKTKTIEDVMKINEDLGYNYNVITLDKCSDHFFHMDCMSDMIGSNEFIKCPVCSRIYGVMTGTQPPGTMKIYLEKGIKCSGYEKYNTIVVKYYFPGGSGFSGTSRAAYLPDTAEGRKILGLLKVCFDRRLIFTVGTSVTTGATNTTVWAGIHHKTNISGGISIYLNLGSSHFGYPDKTYFSRVQEEMAVKGVTADTLPEPPEKIADKLLGLKY